MRGDISTARRHTQNTLATINRTLDKGRLRSPQHHAMLVDAMEKATRTLDNLDRLEHRDRYMDDAISNTMDTINRVLPHLDDYADDAEMARRGYRKRGGGRRVRAGGYTRHTPRSDMDDRYDDYADRMDWHDDMDDYDAEMRRGRRRRDSRGRYMDDTHTPPIMDRTRNDRYDDTRHDDRTADDTSRRQPR